MLNNLLQITYTALVSKLTSLLIVALVSFAFYYLVSIVFTFFERKSKNESFQTLFRVLRRIFRGFIIIATFAFILTLFLKEQYHKFLDDQMNVVITIVFIAVLTVIAASLVRAFFTNTINRIQRREGDTTKYNFYRSIAEVAVYAVGFILIMLSIPKLEKIATTLLGGAGILAVIIGFAAQETFSNIIAGLLIISSKPFKNGDLIQISDSMIGTVWDISLRHTIIKDFDNKMLVIPNSVMNKEKLVNYYLGDVRACERIEIGISYESDIDLAKKIMAEEVDKHPLSIDRRTDYDKETGVPKVVTKVTRLAESAVIVRVWAWSHNYDSAWSLRCDVIESIKKRFDKEGIVIPYPQRTVSFINQQPVKVTVVENEKEGE